MAGHCDGPVLGPALGPVLGIESSCDETAAAVLAGDGRILAEGLVSQFAEHAPYRGVVPEIAARAHLELLPGLLDRVMRESGVDYGGLAGVAAASGPGLIGGLVVGSGFAKGIAIARGLPYVAVNHLEGHALSVRLPGVVAAGVAFPYLLLLVSGGHSEFVAVHGLGDYEIYGRTIDDAAGEAFDKAGKMLGLPWPGGPHLERLAESGEAGAVALPRPLMGREGCDLSFSGLKTAVARRLAEPSVRPQDVAASFQAAVAAVLADRAGNAMARFEAIHPAARLLVVAGGVAANRAVRTALEAAAARRGFRLAAPPLRLCTDNAVMIAWAAIERLRAGQASGIDVAPDPRWRLDAASLRVA